MVSSVLLTAITCFALGWVIAWLIDRLFGRPNESIVSNTTRLSGAGPLTWGGIPHPHPWAPPEAQAKYLPWFKFQLSMALNH